VPRRTPLTAMFEKQLAGVLNRVLGEYVAGLDHDALSLSVWKVRSPSTLRRCTQG
jgi:hypothetical protein